MVNEWHMSAWFIKKLIRNKDNTMSKYIVWYQGLTITTFNCKLIWFLMVQRCFSVRVETFYQSSACRFELPIRREVVERSTVRETGREILCRARAEDWREVGRETLCRVGAEDGHEIMIFICMIKSQEKNNCLVIYPDIVLIGDRSAHATDYRATSNSCDRSSPSKMVYIVCQGI